MTAIETPCASGWRTECRAGYPRSRILLVPGHRLESGRLKRVITSTSSYPNSPGHEAKEVAVTFDSSALYLGCVVCPSSSASDFSFQIERAVVSEDDVFLVFALWCTDEEGISLLC